jgi:hypothetical protein
MRSENLIENDLNTQGYAVLKNVISSTECTSLISRYTAEDGYRSRVVMQRHGFGKGEYKYYSYPLPGIVQEFRGQYYEVLAGIANRWNISLGSDLRIPGTHKEYLALCHSAGQKKPTPLILKYEEEDYNCLHQDIYGVHVFPLQMAILLSEPNQAFTGGEFVLTEQRPRMQSRTEVVPLQRGDAVVFPVQQRPVQGKRGYYRVNMRHGVSRVRSGQRYTLGIIFHDAE